MTREDMIELIYLSQGSKSASQMRDPPRYNIHVFRILPRYHSHLASPRGTSYSNVIVSPRDSTWYDTRFFPTYAPRGGPPYDVIAFLKSRIAPRGADSLSLRGSTTNSACPLFCGILPAPIWLRKSAYFHITVGTMDTSCFTVVSLSLQCPVSFET